jgi:hypothetical protein
MSEVTQLLEQAAAEPYGDSKVALCAAAVDRADAEGDRDLGYQARLALNRAAPFADAGMQVISSYSWLLARYDEDPERFPLQLWNYKWAVAALPDFVSVSLVQIERVLDDFEARYRAAGALAAPVAKLRMRTLLAVGDLDGGAKALETWLRCDRRPYVRLNDCEACDSCDHGRALAILGQHRQALEVAAPVLDGRLTCTTEPHEALALMLESARQVGDLKLGRSFQRRGYPLVRSNRAFIGAIGDHLRFLVLSGDPTTASEMLARHRHWADLSRNDIKRLAFLRGGRLVAAADSSGHDHAMDRQARDLASAFDARNGNDFYRDLLAADDRELAASFGRSGWA